MKLTATELRRDLFSTLERVVQGEVRRHYERAVW